MGIIEKRGADRTARIEFLKKRPNCLSSMGQRSCAVTNIVDGMEREGGITLWIDGRSNGLNGLSRSGRI